VVALVDAKHLPARLKDSREAEDQIAFADVVLLNKTDLVSRRKSCTPSSTRSGQSIRMPASTAPNAR
jgi:G3E family GTPase